MIKLIKELLRSKFYDDKEVGGSFTFYDTVCGETKVGTIYHIVGMEDNTITYQKTWYGYKQGKEVEVSKTEFRYLVTGGDYHDSDYLYGLR